MKKILAAAFVVLALPAYAFAEEPSGFGYDPVFYLPDHGCTMAELPSAVKNQISHRARAAQAARLFLHKLATNY